MARPTFLAARSCAALGKSLLAPLLLALTVTVVTPAVGWTQQDAANEEASLDPAEPESTSGESDGPAVPVADPGLSFLNLLTRGGWFMVPLGLLSILVVTLGIERGLNLRKEKLFPPKLVSQIARITQMEGGLDPRLVYQVCQQYPSSASYVLRSVLSRVGRPQVELEHVLSEATQREATRLNSVNSWLTLAAAVAPLIGLLGTVWGITQAFYDTTQLVEGQNRAEALAQGIYTALVTTMCGLSIAIPAAVLAHTFENRIVATMNQIQEMVSNLMPQFERYEGQLRFTQEGPGEPPSDARRAAAGGRRRARGRAADDELPSVRPS